MDFQKKILFAEDNPADVELFNLSIGSGFINTELIHFPNGQELVNYLDKRPLMDIALIILDLNMPKMGGMDVLRFFNSDPELKKVPVVVFTSSANQPEVSACYELGANAYVKKPLDIADFERTIQTLVHFWCEINIQVEFSPI